MGLVKKDCFKPVTVALDATQYAANDSMDGDAIIMQLNDKSPLVRRDAVKALRFEDNAVEQLLNQLNREQSPLVVAAILDSLQYCCQDDQQATDIVATLLSMLAHMSASKRNSTIVFFSALPEQMQRHMPQLLTSDNKDVQLYALDILRSMNHPQTPVWLGLILAQELHDNVLISVLDRIADFQAVELLEQVTSLNTDGRDPLVGFSVMLTIQRLGGDCAHA
tara:strand:+ start:3110 stop:3775 length:666 start_codon:yes stop_codon:yes gene_type:complete